MHYKSSFNALIVLCNAHYNALYNLMINGNYRQLIIKQCILN